MRIPRWDWDKQAFVYDEYPNELFEPFLTWLMTTRAWIEHPDLVNAKVLGLQRAMLEHRSVPDTHREADAPAPVTPAEALAAKRRASLEKARAARKLKRELAHAEA